MSKLDICLRVTDNKSKAGKIGEISLENKDAQELVERHLAGTPLFLQDPKVTNVVDKKAEAAKAEEKRLKERDAELKKVLAKKDKQKAAQLEAAEAKEQKLNKAKAAKAEAKKEVAKLSKEEVEHLQKHNAEIIKTLKKKKAAAEAAKDKEAAKRYAKQISEIEESTPKKAND